MPIMPTWTPRWNGRAASPLEVKIAVPLPYGLALIRSIAASTSSSAQHRQHRPEDLLAVDVHVRASPGRSRVGPDEEAVLVAGARAGRGRRRSAWRPAPRRLPMRPTIRSRAAAVTTGPISLSASRPGPTLTARALLADRRPPARRPPPPTATAAEIAMQRSPAEPKAAATRWSAAKSRSASGSTIGVVLRAAEGLHPLAAARCPCSWMYFAIGVEPTNETAATSGWSSSASTAVLVAVHDVEDAVGQAGLGPQLGDQDRRADGSRSLGLSTKVLPQAIATGYIHIGTMAGKLNGVMPAHTPSGCAERVHVDAGRDLVGEVALEQLRDAAGELDDLQAALHLAAGVARRPCRARR